MNLHANAKLGLARRPKLTDGQARVRRRQLQAAPRPSRCPARSGHSRAGHKTQLLYQLADLDPVGVHSPKRPPAGAHKPIPAADRRSCHSMSARTTCRREIEKPGERHAQEQVSASRSSRTRVFADRRRRSGSACRLSAHSRQPRPAVPQRAGRTRERGGRSTSRSTHCRYADGGDRVVIEQ
jgi:hypothetical protein